MTNIESIESIESLKKFVYIKKNSVLSQFGYNSQEKELVATNGDYLIALKGIVLSDDMISSRPIVVNPITLKEEKALGPYPPYTQLMPEKERMVQCQLSIKELVNCINIKKSKGLHFLLSFTDNKISAQLEIVEGEPVQNAGFLGTDYPSELEGHSIILDRKYLLKFLTLLKKDKAISFTAYLDTSKKAELERLIYNQKTKKYERKTAVNSLINPLYVETEKYKYLLMPVIGAKESYFA